MKIYLGYGYLDWTTGAYWEKALRKLSEVKFCGIGKDSLPGAACGFDISLSLDQAKAEDVFIYIDSGEPYFPRNIQKLRCLTVCYLIDLHVDVAFRMELAKYFDLVLLAQKDYLELFRNEGFRNVVWVPFGADPEIYHKTSDSLKYDIGFVGHQRSDNLRRNMMLELLSGKYIMNDFRKVYTPQESAEIYSSSKLVFNCSAKGDLNMRIFEALSCGRMLLTDNIKNGLGDIFENRKHLVTYNDHSELLALAGYYLKNDQEREVIAGSGHKHVLLEHTYERRMQGVLEIIASQRSVKPDSQAFFRNKSSREVSLSLSKIYCHWQLNKEVIAELFKDNSPGTFVFKSWYLLKNALRSWKRFLLKKITS